RVIAITAATIEPHVASTNLYIAKLIDAIRNQINSTKMDVRLLRVISSSIQPSCGNLARASRRILLAVFDAGTRVANKTKTRPTPVISRSPLAAPKAMVPAATHAARRSPKVMEMGVDGSTSG